MATAASAAAMSENFIVGSFRWYGRVVTTWPVLRPWESRDGVSIDHVLADSIEKTSDGVGFMSVAGVVDAIE